MKRNAKTAFMLIAMNLAAFTISKADFPTYAEEYQDRDEAGHGLTGHFINSDNLIDLVTTNLDLMENGYTWFNDNQNPGNFSPNQEISGGREAKFGFLTSADEWRLAVAGGILIAHYNVNEETEVLDQEQTIYNYTYPADFLCWGHINGDEYGDVVATDDGSTNAVLMYTGYRSEYQGNARYRLYPFQSTYLFTPGYDLDQLALVRMDNYWGPYALRWDLLAVDGSNSRYIRLFPNDVESLVYFNTTNMQTFDAVDAIRDFALGDIDDDGYEDLVLCTNNTTTEDYYVKIYMNNRDGGFTTPPQSQPFDDWIDQVALADVGFYGYACLAVYCAGGTVQMFPNNSGQIEFDDPAPPIYVPQNSGWIEANELLYVDLAGNGAYSLAMTGIEDETDPGLWIWYNDGPLPYIHPVHHLAVDGIQGGHPTVLWGESEDFDVEKYIIYRALMEDTTRPTEGDFDSLAYVSYPTTEFTDTTVIIHSQEDNYKIWYTVTAMDDDDNESIKLQYVTFWGYYEDGGGYRFYESVNYGLSGEFMVKVAPNPLNPRTTFSFDLPVAGPVELAVYDLSGRLVSALIDGWRDAGSYNLSWDANNLPSGIYLYRLSAGHSVASGKMALMK